MYGLTLRCERLLLIAAIPVIAGKLFLLPMVNSLENQQTADSTGKQIRKTSLRSNRTQATTEKNAPTTLDYA